MKRTGIESRTYTPSHSHLASHIWKIFDLYQRNNGFIHIFSTLFHFRYMHCLQTQLKATNTHTHACITTVCYQGTSHFVSNGFVLDRFLGFLKDIKEYGKKKRAAWRASEKGNVV